ncbi:MAG: hypothetical protein AMJ77_02815 [Dehalococcoidia bacterium SM23_28_2]|nr:MAG: hypothetical protein AMJ77_02815 [Dehalococcoidia bacterium SM23_28_2]
MSGGLETSIVEILLISSTYPDTVYAGTRGDGVFRSVDGGATWWPWNEGFPPGNVTISALIPDPFDGKRLYIGTNTGAYYRSDPGPVGGIAEILVGGSEAPTRVAERSGSSSPLYAAIASAAALALSAGAWYARRRLLR